jgi:hypothetical protein
MSGDTPHSDDGARPHAGPVPLHEIYDEATLALIEAPRRPAPRSLLPAVSVSHTGTTTDAEASRSSSATSSVRRVGAQGAVLAGVMLGVGEVFEPEQAKQAMVEFVPDAVDRGNEPIEFVYVHGFPHRSRIIVRPWLVR